MSSRISLRCWPAENWVKHHLHDMLTNLLNPTADTFPACRPCDMCTLGFHSCESQLTCQWEVKDLESRNLTDFRLYSDTFSFSAEQMTFSLSLIDVFSSYHSFCSLPPCLCHSFSTLFLLGATWQAGSVTGCCWHNKPNPRKTYIVPHTFSSREKWKETGWVLHVRGGLCSLSV